MIMKTKIKGILSLLLATVIWGGAFVAQSAGVELIGPFTFQAIRCALAVLALIVFIAIWEIRDLKGCLTKWLDPKLWKTGLICGLALFVASGLQQIGLVYTDAGKAGFLTAMYIVIVPLFGLFFRQKPNFMTWVCIAIAVAGMYLLCCAGVTQINIGDILLCGCAVAFAAQITLVDRYAGNMDSLRLNCIQALVVAVLSAVFMVFTEKLDGNLILSCWLPLAYAGVLSMGAGYSLQIIGQKYVESTTASLLMSLESVFAVVFASLLLHETMTSAEAIGCCLVFVAVILSQVPVGKKAN
jgi:drug/metabolite transporter (DMT)-like permease